MGFFSRLFESKEQKAARLAKEAEEQRKAEEREAKRKARKTKEEREEIVREIKGILDRSKTVVASENNYEFVGLARALKELTPKAAAYVERNPKDYPVGFLSCLVTGLGIRVECFRVPQLHNHDTEGRLTITALAHMAEHPECVAEAAAMVASTPMPELNLGASDVQSVMAVYGKFWKAFVGDRNLECPLDVGNGESVRKYLTARGKW